MTYIRSIATSLPKWRYPTEEVISACRAWLSESEFALFEKFSRSSRIKFRHFAAPIDEILALGGMSRRVDIYTESGTELASICLQKLIEKNGLSPEEIDTLIWSSCSVPAIPSIDIYVADRAELSKTINRIPMYQHGCVGGAIALSLGARLCSAQNKIVITALELCSLVHQSLDRSGGNLLGAALFADGAASVLLSPDSGPVEVVDSLTYRIPESGFALGYTINDMGTFLKLEKELPALIAKALPDAVSILLKRNQLEQSGIAHYLVHPGGAKILESFEKDMQLSDRSLRFSWEVLEHCGNISSAAIFHVIEKFLDEKSYQDGDYGLAFGIGPGVTLELILFLCHR